MTSKSSENKILAKIKNYLTWQLLIGVVVGAIAGYAYYHFVGCKSGSCSITSDPTKTVMWGVLLGGVIGFKDKSKKKKKKDAVINEEITEHDEVKLDSKEAVIRDTNKM